MQKTLKLKAAQLQEKSTVTVEIHSIILLQCYIILLDLGEGKFYK